MISFITACTRPEMVEELLPTVVGQPGEIEWIVQLDGQAIAAADRVGAALAPYDWASVRVNAEPQGSGATRNRALSEARGELVLCVDDDDLLVPNSVHLLAEALASNPEAFGACGATECFGESPAETVSFKRWSEGRLIEPGSLLAGFESSGEIALHVGACLWRRERLAAIGGFAALPRSIDTAPFLACSAVWPLVYVDVPVYLYRRHTAQMSRTDAYREARPWVHRTVAERARLMASLMS